MGATSPSFQSQSKSTKPSTSSMQFKGRSKRPPPSQGYSPMQWVKLHSSLQEVAKYGGPKMYTMEQVRQHNTREDCWMVLNGHVFDVTKYVPFHPGGDDILKGKGRDATVLFATIHRWVNIDALIKNCWIGQVINYKPPKMKSRNGKRKKNVANKVDNGQSAK